MDDMTGHDIAERTRVLSHGIYARAVDTDPTLIEQAKAQIERLISGDRGTKGHELWQLLLRRPWPEVRARMLAETPEGRLLRSNSPFSTLIGIQDPDERSRLWRQAKHDLSARTTSSALSAA
ncbi:hypothetical protein [Sphingomonas beigongshangi]|uniref:hypothetical protein n=1 Tax=Sphingomonas beigongshangi TaxID=2782540 RepID=UPI001AEE2409|nr:hypothetical protein [Sphingomonas beigongshangi]